MNNPDFLAQAAHSGWACAIVLIANLLGGTWACLIVAALMVGYAAVKEFWFDANFEIPKQTAADNWEDFAGYMGGLVFGLLVVFVVHPLLQ